MTTDNAHWEMPLLQRENDRREFVFTLADFEQVRKLIYEYAGISLSPAKQDMVYSRLVKRLREKGMKTFSEYLESLKQSNDKDEWEEFVNSLTTNLTSFFREPHHFSILEAHLKKLRDKSSIKIWCCASSTGEEPYSLAMTAVEAFNSFNIPVSIFASDLDTNVLATATKGVYARDRVDRLSHERLSRFFLKNDMGRGDVSFSVRPELRRLVTFQRLNLLEPNWGVRGPLDVLFCRNIMIYFDKPTQYKILKRFVPLMDDNGLLFAGHSESFLFASDLFHLQGDTVYELANKTRSTKAEHELADKTGVVKTVHELANKARSVKTVQELANKARSAETVHESANKARSVKTVHELADKARRVETVHESANKARRVETVHESANKARVVKTVQESADKKRGVSKTPMPETVGRSSITSRIIFVGASTGGTEAIKNFLLGFPVDCPPTLIVQHMPESFTGSFAMRLNGLCQPRVIEARGGEILAPGVVYLSPGHSHMRVRRSGTGYATELLKTQPVNRHRPSVDVLFDSAAEVVGHRAVGVILTGMGKDGANGLLRMRQGGARTFGQDEASCVVYGMPREAVLIGAVEEVDNLEALAQKALAAAHTV